MTHTEDIIRMAHEAGIIHPEMVNKTLERFAALVAAAEREACAKVCEQEWSNAAERDFGEQCAAIIRGREVRGQA